MYPRGAPIRHLEYACLKPMGADFEPEWLHNTVALFYAFMFETMHGRTLKFTVFGKSLRSFTDSLDFFGYVFVFQQMGGHWLAVGWAGGGPHETKTKRDNETVTARPPEGGIP